MKIKYLKQNNNEPQLLKEKESVTEDKSKKPNLQSVKDYQARQKIMKQNKALEIIKKQTKLDELKSTYPSLARGEKMLNTKKKKNTRIN